MLFFLFLFFSLTTTQRMLFASSPHAHTHTAPLTQHKKSTIRPWRPTDRSRHHPYLPPHMGDHPQTFFIPFSTSLRTIRCVGSFSATPDCTSAADDQHGHAIHDFDTSGPRPIRGEAISPPICMKQLPPAFEYLRKVYPTF